MKRIVVTGSSGLIGAALVDQFKLDGVAVTGIDLRPAETTDVVQRLTPDTDFAPLLAGCAGVIHLAGVSRVVWGQRDPLTTWTDNVCNTGALINAVSKMAEPPWLIYGSSREVYGQVAQLPVMDDAPVAPLNIYAYSKAASEILLDQAFKNGLLHGAIVRFSTVYGGLNDHPDRVIPAFTHAAAANAPMTVFGEHLALDPTWLGDVVDGVTRLCSALNEHRVPQRPILFSSGTLVRAFDMAGMLRKILGASSPIIVTKPRTYDVERFAGMPRYASDFLGWMPTTPLATGLRIYAETLRSRAVA
jgi:nucleoside-diphosphate-sugar epimerase